MIDGDHTLAGVSQDYALYAPLVSTPGVIGLHDIHRDYRTSRGVATGVHSGEVPVFWQDVKRQEKDTHEFIAATEQDGYGIGAVQHR